MVRVSTSLLQRKGPLSEARFADFVRGVGRNLRDAPSAAHSYKAASKRYTHHVDKYDFAKRTQVRPAVDALLHHRKKRPDLKGAAKTAYERKHRENLDVAVDARQPHLIGRRQARREMSDIRNRYAGTIATVAAIPALAWAGVKTYKAFKKAQKPPSYNPYDVYSLGSGRYGAQSSAKYRQPVYYDDEEQEKLMRPYGMANPYESLDEETKARLVNGYRRKLRTTPSFEVNEN